LTTARSPFFPALSLGKRNEKKKLLFQKEVLHTTLKRQVQLLTLYWALPPQGQFPSEKVSLQEKLFFENFGI